MRPTKNAQQAAMAHHSPGLICRRCAQNRMKAAASRKGSVVSVRRENETEDQLPVHRAHLNKSMVLVIQLMWTNAPARRWKLTPATVSCVPLRLPYRMALRAYQGAASKRITKLSSAVRRLTWRRRKRRIRNAAKMGTKARKYALVSRPAVNRAASKSRYLGRLSRAARTSNARKHALRGIASQSLST